MQSILQVVLLGLAITVVLVTIREQRPEWGFILRVGSGAVLLLLVAGPLTRVAGEVAHLATLANVRGIYLGLVLKVIGITYLTTFAAQVAYDTGESGTAWRVEVAGKILILVLSLPLIAAITETVLKMIPS
ncbi:MAG: stage III sporulation protein AD [Thermaerobacter sp.]|nr:stage III sporulation protein AD [Thermaerobacter sp.]